MEPSAGGISPESLLRHARRYAQSPGSENARSNFIVRVQCCQNIEALQTVAREFPLAPEISLLAWQRLAALRPHERDFVLGAAQAFYTHGYDEPALALLNGLLEHTPHDLPALELKAALTADPLERRRIFEEMLRVDPGNRVAVESLILLDRPR